MVGQRVSRTLVFCSLVAAFLPAQAPQAAGAVRSASARIPGTDLYRCAAPTHSLVSSIDHPDCDGGSTNPLPSYEGSTLRIPLVFHILHKTDGQGNVTDPQVQSQVTVLNEDFRAIPGTPGAQGYDSKIEFVLASTDPQGAGTTGILRYANDDWHDDVGDYWFSTAWDTSRYLNIYVNSPFGGTVLGYVPAMPHHGLVLNTAADRVVINHLALGRPGAMANFGGGRTCTHEVGHYLGLFHTFSGGCDVGSCYSSGDLICDTAPEVTPNFGCNPASFSCGSPDPVRNYMDYSNDACMQGFTQEQARRMRCTLQSYRPLLAHPVGPFAAATVRAGQGNYNGAFSCSAPVLGAIMTATIDGAGLPYSLGGVYGFTGATTSLVGGYTLLIDLDSAFVLELPVKPFNGAAMAAWGVPIPHEPSLSGLPIKTQGLMIGQSFGLTNAVDLVVGH